MKKILLLVLYFICGLTYSQSDEIDNLHFRNIDPEILMSTQRGVADLPPGYSFSTLPLEFNNPMDIEFIETNGVKYMLVGERGGDVWLCTWVDNNWVKETAPLVELPTSTFFERGLQSIVVRENRLWVFHTLDEDVYHGDDSGVTQRLTVNRVVKFNTDLSVNSASNESVLLTSPSLAANHQGGGMVELNGELYIAIGDGASSTYGDEAVEDGLITPEAESPLSRAKSQRLDSFIGKIVRIDAETGEASPDNPWFGDSNPLTLDEIYAIGFRNPFDINFTPEGFPIIADVGAGDREDVNIVKVAGENCGWGVYEGFSYLPLPGTNPTTGFPYIINQPTSFVPPSNLNELVTTHNLPEFDYAHDDSQTRFPIINGDGVTTENDSNGIIGRSITGGCFIGTGFGPDFEGTYIFSDYISGFLNVALPSNDSNGRYFTNTENFAPDGTVNGAVDITQNPFNGDLYIARLFGGINIIKYEGTLSTSISSEYTEDLMIIYKSYSGIYTFKNVEQGSWLTITDTSGKRLLKTQIWDGYENRFNFTSGIYVVKIIKGQKKTVKKLIIN